MFKCEDCGEVFADPKFEYETHGLDSPPYERWALCPHCNSTNFAEAKKCSRCEEFVAELNDDLCDICYSDLYD